jgi:hypothetical protein
MWSSWIHNNIWWRLRFWSFPKLPTVELAKLCFDCEDIKSCDSLGDW